LTATSGSPTRKKRIPRETFTSIVTVTASIPVTALANVLTNIIPSLVAQKETLIKDKRNKIKDKRKKEKGARCRVQGKNKRSPPGFVH
jgi:predicted RND superfamily exporter protein